MKLLKEPPRQDFSTYVARPEVHFIRREADDPLKEIYARGYLPYSGSQDLYNIFYSARSARIVLPELKITSENRRIAKKFDGTLTKRRIPIDGFKSNEKFYDFWIAYFAKRHGPDVAPRARIELWVESSSAVIEYKRGDATVGYVLEVEDGDMRHYWYSAFDLAYIKQSLGMWLMLDCIRDAKAAGVKHYYLGTVYGGKALYKTNFEPLEWWDSAAWSRDIGRLKKLARED